jgi:hypothetical protein
MPDSSDPSARSPIASANVRAFTIAPARHDGKEMADTEARVATGPATAGAPTPAILADAHRAAPPASPEPARASTSEPRWLWQKNQRRFIHEMTDAELQELVNAWENGAREEGFEIAPHAANDRLRFTRFDRKDWEPYVGWENMTMEQRRARWGYRTSAELRAEREAKAADAPAGNRGGAADRG